MADVVIAGAGIIGLSLALELEHRGAHVTVLDAGRALQQASSAAAGMLADDDPDNPPALHPLARLSIELYPAFLDRLEALTGERIPFQTSYTLQAVEETADALDDPNVLIPQLVAGPHRFRLLTENSIDPRQLATVLANAIRATSIDLREDTPLTRIAATPTNITINNDIAADFLVDCMGAWTPAPVAPVKGQMLAVELPASLPLEAVLRTRDFYVVPRTLGPNAGRAIIGATVEHVGFDKAIRPLDILTLHARASALLPELKEAHFLESWAGLRPGTADGLPILGATARQPRYILATGHYRNGMLLAPATARVLADLLDGSASAVDLSPFDPARFPGR